MMVNFGLAWVPASGPPAEWRTGTYVRVMSTLERAIAIAVEAHTGQVDKAGEPYILHPIRVMLGVRTPEARIAAILHDVVEDSAWTIDDLRRERFSEAILAAVDSVTRRKAESYEEFVERSDKDPLGREVKIADLRDNADLSRIATPTEKDRMRIQKYLKALATLGAAESSEK